MTAAEKGKATRERLNTARAAAWEEQREAIRAARTGLQKVFESPEATPEQILEAASILVKLGEH